MHMKVTMTGLERAETGSAFLRRKKQMGYIEILRYGEMRQDR